jgi:hypothetical protein
MKWYAIVRRTSADVKQRYHYASVRERQIVWILSLEDALHFDSLKEAENWKRAKELSHKNFGIVEFEFPEF